MKHRIFFFTLTALLVAVLACSVFSGGSREAPPVGENGVPEKNPPPEAPSENNSEKYDTEFPVPSDVKNFTKLGEDTINYQTSMTLTEVVDFYRNQFEKTGYTEREITTVINDTTFSIVWDGHPSGKALVVQGVDLGDGTVNVNVRLEDV